MSEHNIEVQCGMKTYDSDSVIMVPMKALEEAGYIKAFSLQDGANAKHEFHAMSQVVYYQYQDDEMEVEAADTSISVIHQNEEEQIDGLVIYRNTEGAFHVLSCEMELNKKLLETAFRFCTRWVRLDI